MDTRTVKVLIYTFGSYKLGVHNTSSDIDTLCVAPCHITRDQFFSESLFDKLKTNKNLNEFNPITSANVPIIKMKIDEVEIDLLFARLPEAVITQD